MTNSLQNLREFLGAKAEMLAYAGTKTSYRLGLETHTAGARSRRLGYLIHAAGEDKSLQYIQQEIVDVNRPIGVLDVTPLMLAALNEKLAVVKLLLAKGADPLAKNKRGMTARDHVSGLRFAPSPADEINRVIKKAEQETRAKDADTMAVFLHDIRAQLRRREPLKRGTYGFFLTELNHGMGPFERERFLRRGDHLKVLEDAVTSEFPWVNHLRLGDIGGVIYDSMPNTFGRRLNAKIPDYSW